MAGAGGIRAAAVVGHRVQVGAVATSAASSVSESGRGRPPNSRKLTLAAC